MKNALPPPPDGALKLPAWRSMAEAMISSGIEYGDSYSKEWIEGWLRVKAGDIKYGMLMAKVRKELEESGFYILVKQEGTGIIMPPETNVQKVRERNKAAVTKLRRAVILGANTDGTALDPENKRVLEGETERAALRLALMSRRALA